MFNRILDAIKPNMLFWAIIHFAVTLYGDTFVFVVPYNALYYWTKLFVLAFLIWFWQRVPDWINVLNPGRAVHRPVSTF